MANSFNGQAEHFTVRFLVMGKEIISLTRDNGDRYRYIKNEYSDETKLHHFKLNTNHVKRIKTVFMVYDFYGNPCHAQALRGGLIASGAKISISEGTVRERIIIITGSLDSIYRATDLILESFIGYLRFEERFNNRKPSNIPYTLMMLVPVSHCGQLIGKGGAKLKELREMSGAMVQVTDRVFPNSTERLCNITSNNPESVADCVSHIAEIIGYGPMKGNNTGFYKPYLKEIRGPILFSNGQPYILQGTMAIPADDEVYDRLFHFPEVAEYCESYNGGDIM